MTPEVSATCLVSLAGVGMISGFRHGLRVGIEVPLGEELLYGLLLVLGGLAGMAADPGIAELGAVAGLTGIFWFLGCVVHKVRKLWRGRRS